ncbi:MAG: hypothetical protein J7513_07785 [Solirubrobacteraceae bacterium]|nr:hypothetical protein [Solirubrobacteraceae bacterium]
MADEPKLSAPDRDLFDLSLRTQPDPYLSDLVELAHHGTELAVGLLVNGMVIIGRLNRQEAIAAALSSMRRVLIDSSPKPDDQTDEQWEQVREQFSNAPLLYSQDRAEQEAAVYEAIGEYVVDGSVDVNDLPEDLARQVREVSARPHLTLTDARIAAPGQQGMTSLPVIRVAAAQVSAWWFAMPEADGTSNIELWND